MRLNSLLKAVSFAVICAVSAIPAFADIIPCASGNLSTVDFTTCTIGNLQFDFVGLVSENTSGPAWADSDFNFTVLSNGFELSGPPAQTVNSTPENSNLDFVQLRFYVTDLDGVITNLGVSELSTTSIEPSFEDYALNDLSLFGPGLVDPGIDGQVVLNSGNTAYSGSDQRSYDMVTGPAFSGYGTAEPFEVSASNGASSSLDSTATYFIFTTGPTPPPPPSTIPEPRLLLPLSIGFLGVVWLARARAHIRRA